MDSLPTQCPTCDRTFGTVLRRPSCMTWAAKLVFALGVLIGLPWAILMIVVSLGTVLIIPTNEESFATWLKLILGPGYALAKMGFQMPRRTARKCYGCGWSGEFSTAGPSFGTRNAAHRLT